jgi:hypothetical protein
MRRMTSGLHTVQTRRPSTSNLFLTVRWPLFAEWRYCVCHDCQSRSFLTSPNCRCHNRKRDKQDLSRSFTTTICEACSPGRPWGATRPVVRRPSRPPCIRPSKLAIYPAAECADDARVILEYCTPSSSVFVSIQLFSRALLTSGVRKHTKISTDVSLSFLLLLRPTNTQLQQPIYVEHHPRVRFVGSQVV